MTNLSPNQFLTQLLESRGLSTVTAEPLFTYQLQQNEYQELKKVVVSLLLKSSFDGQKLKPGLYILLCIVLSGININVNCDLLREYLSLRETLINR